MEAGNGPWLVDAGEDLALEWGFREGLRCPFGASVHSFRPIFRFQMTATSKQVNGPTEMPIQTVSSGRR